MSREELNGMLFLLTRMAARKATSEQEKEALVLAGAALKAAYDCAFCYAVAIGADEESEVQS